MEIIAALLVALGVGLLLAARQNRWQRIQNTARGLLVSYSTLVLALAAGEVYFRYFHAESTTICALACQNWKARYWRENALGFRDREWTPNDWNGRTSILVVGDSFTAGSGIAHPADRFPDVLAAHLGTAYAVINLGVVGATTPRELQTLQAYPLQNPDVVILQYYLNDIDDAALAQGYDPQIGLSMDVPAWINESYLANYAYWGISNYLRATEQNMAQTYRQWSYSMYDNPIVWEIHRQQLEDFIAYVDSIGARLIVVIFPNMLDPFGSIAYVDRVAQVFDDSGHTAVLKLFDVVDAWEINARVVSLGDPHPSAAFSRHVGDLLYERYFGAAP